ncbi:hypothetical protein UlMin_013336 [Ulmus minor]
MIGLAWYLWTYLWPVKFRLWLGLLLTVQPIPQDLVLQLAQQFAQAKHADKLQVSSLSAVILMPRDRLTPGELLRAPNPSVGAIVSILSLICTCRALQSSLYFYFLQIISLCFRFFDYFFCTGLLSYDSFAGTEISAFGKGRENTVRGISLMIGYLGCDGFTSTFQEKLFKGYNMEIHNQIFYTTMCSCIISLILQGQLILAIDFVYWHNDCFFDVALLSTVAAVSQFFISYTIRTFGTLTFATIMTTSQVTFNFKVILILSS